MAHDGYRNPPQPEQYVYEHPDSQHSHRSSYQSGNTQTIPSHERNRPQDMPSIESDTYKADPARYQQARQPIDEAVNSASRGTDNTSVISPEIISQITSQITANVMQHIASNLPLPANITPSGNNVGGLTTSPLAESPQREHRTVYTPPSPTRPLDSHIQPPVSPPPVTAQLKAFPPSQGRITPSEPPKSSTFGQDSQAEEADHREERTDRGARPKGPKRLSTEQDPTIVEKIWGILFDDEGQATPRLGQFLRGIAIHLIEDYEPLNSLVITPPKMQKYYEDTKLSSELLPFHIVFDDHTSSISRLFREIEAQHHLTQAKLDERPDIPGLTPLGFERWATVLLRAYPDQEFERLQKTALDMPISNPDDRKERFPKEISRRLFPNYPDLKIRDKLEKAISIHCSVAIPSRHPSAADSLPQHGSINSRAESFPQSIPNLTPLSQSARDGGHLSPVTSRTTQPSPLGASVERGRLPYSVTPSEGVVEDNREEDLPMSPPIERERKPYVAQPGGGKIHDEVNRPTSPPEYLSPQLTARPARSGSVASHGRANDPPRSRPIPISIHQRPGQPSETLLTPDSATVSYHRSNSTYHQQPPHRGIQKPSPSATANGGAYEHPPQSDLSYGSYQPFADEESRGYRAYESTREKFANDRYDASRMSAYDPSERERERTGRERLQFTAGFEGQRAPYANDDQYYRPVGGHL